jgi:putative ABC transport system permease protein
MVAVGLILALLLHGSMLIGVLILLAMTVAAAVTASQRAPGIKNPLILSFYAIGRVQRRDCHPVRHQDTYL